MKKWLLVLVGLIILIITAAHLLIPAKIEITKHVSVKCTQDGALYILKSPGKWNKWWPGLIKNDSSFILNGLSYITDKRNYAGVKLTMHNNGDSVGNNILVLPIGKDSVDIILKTSVVTGNNPFAKIKGYFFAGKYGADLSSILSSLSKFLDKPENIYGFTVTQMRVVDTLLVSTVDTLSHSPTTTEINDMIMGLKKHIAAEGAQETNPPMLNIGRIDSIHFQVRTAIPVDRGILSTNNATFKRMVAGNILVSSEIKGGPYSVAQAYQAMKKYVNDYRYISPAIPFESLVTDRMQEQDTTRWITRIYYPVF